MFKIEQERKNYFVLALIMLFFGDIFVLGSLFFHSLMVDFILIFSPEYSSIELGTFGKDLLLFFTTMVGAVMYLVGFLFWAVAKPEFSKRLVLFGLFAWFIADSIGSLLFNFEFNVIFNAVFLIIGLIFLYNQQA
ncbi:MAG: hypothetical protein INQ03_02735 [Candidatus Heimdallarchaeota archaeon]|nr:hypothetical protein [Candidatus Heimdallarchaeota archaeon]